MCECVNNVHIHSALSKNSVQNQHSTILLGSIAKCLKIHNTVAIKIIYNFLCVN